jgi:hypothetical protein
MALDFSRNIQRNSPEGAAAKNVAEIITFAGKTLAIG